MNTKRLFHRNFTIMILGQIISLFGNSILRFALSLYVLDKTGSAAVFGAILALSMIPTVLVSPLGGVVADRLPRQKIMVTLDFVTAGLIFLYDLLFSSSGSLVAITALMILLSLIQAFYQPSVQASIPSLASENNLMAANGVVMQVQALASLLGPILGGFLYGFLGLFPILLASGCCFFLSAVMEIFLRIPFIRRERTVRAAAQIKEDLSDAVSFLTRDNPRLIRLLLIIAGLNLFLSSLFIIGLPFLVKVHLGLSSQLYGFAEASLGVGSILGGLLSGPVSRRVAFKRSHLFLIGTTLVLLPFIITLIADAAPLFSYGVLLLSVVLGMGCAALFNIAAQTFLQTQTPNHLLGKVGSFVAAICTCALPIGQALYGGLFDLFKHTPWTVMLFGCAVSLLLAFATKKALYAAARE